MQSGRLSLPDHFHRDCDDHNAHDDHDNDTDDVNVPLKLGITVMVTYYDIRSVNARNNEKLDKVKGAKL